MVKYTIRGRPKTIEDLFFSGHKHLNMPPIKGRMMGRMGGMVSSVQQSTVGLRQIKKLTMARKKVYLCEK